MKIRRNNSSIFESPRQRRRLPIIRIAIAVLFVLSLYLLWGRGGEKPLVRVEKPIPAERLGQ